jgi:serine/threonine protein kinase
MKLNTPEIFKDKKFINEGTFGKVYRATIGDRLYALKKIKEHPKIGGFPTTSVREIKVLKKLAGHPNIVQLEDIVRSKSHAIYLVFEFLETDLEKLWRDPAVVFTKP